MKPIFVRSGQVGAGFLWFGLIFLVSLWVTFPADALAKWARYRVQESSGSTQILQVGELHPYWIGLQGENVALYTRAKGHNRANDDDENESRSSPPIRVFAADALRARIGVFGLLKLVTGGDASVSGSATVEGGDLDFSATIAREAGKLALRAMNIVGEGFPLSAVPSIAGAKLQGTGGLDLDIDLDSAEGFSKSSGHATIASKDLVIESTGTALDAFSLGPIQVSDVDVAFDVTSGKAKVSRGSIASDLVKIAVEGDIVLADDLPQSRVRLKLVFTLGEGMELLEPFFKAGEWQDGKYHYSFAGTFAHPRFRAERERRVRPGAGEAIGPAASLPGIDRDVRLPEPNGDATEASDEDAQAERQKRREASMAARRERLQQRRHEMMDRHERPDGPGGMPPDGEPPLPDDLPLLDRGFDEPPRGIEEPPFPEGMEELPYPDEVYDQ